MIVGMAYAGRQDFPAALRLSGISKRKRGRENADMCKNIMDLITEHAMNERLDAELLCDQQFLALQKK